MEGNASRKSANDTCRAAGDVGDRNLLETALGGERQQRVDDPGARVALRFGLFVLSHARLPQRSYICSLFHFLRQKAGESMETAMPQQSRKIALVTGSTDGVGRFVAERLGADGWDVIVHGRDAERGRAVVATIAAVGGGARFLSADLSDLAAVRGLAEQVAKAAPRLDLLINNAGIGAGGSGAQRQVNAAGVELRSPSIISPASR